MCVCVCVRVCVCVCVCACRRAYVRSAPTLAAGNLFDLAAVCQVVPHAIYVYDGQDVLQVRYMCLPYTYHTYRTHTIRIKIHLKHTTQYDTVLVFM